MGRQSNEKSKKSQFNLPAIANARAQKLTKSNAVYKTTNDPLFPPAIQHIFIKAPTPNNSHCQRASWPQPNQQNDWSCWRALRRLPAILGSEGEHSLRRHEWGHENRGH
jgi:hypothetical protein